MSCYSLWVPLSFKCPVRHTWHFVVGHVLTSVAHFNQTPDSRRLTAQKATHDQSPPTLPSVPIPRSSLISIKLTFFRRRKIKEKGREENFPMAYLDSWLRPFFGGKKTFQYQRERINLLRKMKKERKDPKEYWIGLYIMCSRKDEIFPPG